MLLSGAPKQTSDHRQHLLCVRARSKRELWEGLGYLLHIRMYVTAYVIQVASTFVAYKLFTYKRNNISLFDNFSQFWHRLYKFKKDEQLNSKTFLAVSIRNIL